MRNSGFTLIELLVVIAVIGLLTALLLPALQMVVEASRRTVCVQNLKQMGIAMKLYHADQNFFPSTWVNGDTSWTWARCILPYLDQQALANRWDQNKNVNEGVNAEISATPISTFNCPSARSPDTYYYGSTDFAGRYGVNDYKGCQSVNASDPLLVNWNLKDWIPGIVSRWPVRDIDVTDGLSKTLLLVESVGGPVIYGPSGRVYSRIPQIWYATDGAWMGRALSGMSPTSFGITFKIPFCGVNCTNMYDYGPYSFHPGGANVLLADGTATFLGESTDLRILCALYSYADGQLGTLPE